MIYIFLMKNSNILGFFICITLILSLLTTSTMHYKSNSTYAQHVQKQSNNISSSLQSLTGIPYPNIPHENQDAVEHTKKFSPPSIVKVTDGVYSAIGY